MFVPPDSGPKGPVSLFGNILVILTTGSESKSQYIPLKLRRQRTMDCYQLFFAIIKVSCNCSTTSISLLWHLSPSKSSGHSQEGIPPTAFHLQLPPFRHKSAKLSHLSERVNYSFEMVVINIFIIDIKLLDHRSITKCNINWFS